jgi:hypothetical protein
MQSLAGGIPLVRTDDFPRKGWVLYTIRVSTFTAQRFMNRLKEIEGIKHVQRNDFTRHGRKYAAVSWTCKQAEFEVEVSNADPA